MRRRLFIIFLLSLTLFLSQPSFGNFNYDIKLTLTTLMATLLLLLLEIESEEDEDKVGPFIIRGKP